MRSFSSLASVAVLVACGSTSAAPAPTAAPAPADPAPSPPAEPAPGPAELEVADREEEEEAPEDEDLPLPEELEDAIARLSHAPGDLALRCEVAEGLARSERFVDAERGLDEAIAALDRDPAARDPRAIARCLTARGLLRLRAGDRESAYDDLERAQWHWPTIDDLHTVGAPAARLGSEMMAHPRARTDARLAAPTLEALVDRVRDERCGSRPGCRVELGARSERAAIVVQTFAWSHAPGGIEVPSRMTLRQLAVSDGSGWALRAIVHTAYEEDGHRLRTEVTMPGDALPSVPGAIVVALHETGTIDTDCGNEGDCRERRERIDERWLVVCGDPPGGATLACTEVDRLLPDGRAVRRGETLTLADELTSALRVPDLPR